MLVSTLSSMWFRSHWRFSRCFRLYSVHSTLPSSSFPPPVIARTNRGAGARVNTRDIPTVSISTSVLHRDMAAATGGSDTDKLVVEHDPKKNKFFIKLGSAEAKLEYVKEKHENGYFLNMWHTEVPPQLQGKGIAKILAKEAFDYVVANNLKMQLTCSYLQKYYNDNPLDKYKTVIFIG